MFEAELDSCAENYPQRRTHSLRLQANFVMLFGSFLQRVDAQAPAREAILVSGNVSCFKKAAGAHL
jgi:hypothetical protein